jgi:hypothetical protein
MLEQDNGTNSCILGPFYVADPPRYENGDTIIQKYLGGEVTYFHGRILDADTNLPVAGTSIYSSNSTGQGWLTRVYRCISKRLGVCSQRTV